MHTFFANLLFIIYFFPTPIHSVTLAETDTLQDDSFTKADRIIVSNGYAYLTSTDTSASGEYDYLTIVNLNGLEVTGTLQNSTFADTPAIGVSSDGNYVYAVSAFYQRLVVVDVVDKSAPFIVGFLEDDYFADAHSLVIAGDYLFVSDGTTNAVTVVSINGSPSLLGSIATESLPTTLAAANDKLFVGSSTNKLEIFDISDLSDLSQVTSSSLTGPSGCSYKKSSGMLASGTDLYMAVNIHSLVVINAETASPAQASCLEDADMQDVIIGHTDGDYLCAVALDSSDSYRVLLIPNTDTTAMSLDNIVAETITGTPIAIVGEGEKIYVLKEQHTIDEFTITIPTTLEPATTSESATTTSDSTSSSSSTLEDNNVSDEIVNNNNESTEVQGTLTWWILILVTIIAMCVCIPCCAYVNQKYVRPARIARMNRLENEKYSYNDYEDTPKTNTRSMWGSSASRERGLSLNEQANTNTVKWDYARDVPDYHD